MTNPLAVITGVNGSLDSADAAYDILSFPEPHIELARRQSSLSAEGSLPYRSVYFRNYSHDDIERDVFIPNKSVKVKIVEIERRHGRTHFFSPNLYIIEVQHADFKWIIKRRYKDFSNLHTQLQLFRAKVGLRLPTATVKKIRTLKDAVNQVKYTPKFPQKPEAFVSTDQTKERADQLERYLNNLLMSKLFRNHKDTLEFLEISHLSFVRELGEKHKESIVRKKAGGFRNATGIRSWLDPCRSLCRGWLERWLMLKDTFLTLIRPEDGAVREVILFDSKFSVKFGFHDTRARRGIKITNQNRTVLLKGLHREVVVEWVQAINEVAQTTGKEFVERNRFGAFAPARQDVLAKWFVDGESYFEAVAEGLKEAKEEIFITDWMLSAELYLRRPVADNIDLRLDIILERKAKEGVKVFVMIYKEVELALGINSNHARKWLMDKSANIKVLRHPDHVAGGVMLWAHHEKIVVIDQKYAFLGGIDICFGRWDNRDHRLTDVDSSERPSQKGVSHFTSTVLTGVGRNLMLLPMLSGESINEDCEVKEYKSTSFPSLATTAQTSNTKLVRIDSLDTMVVKRQWPGKDYMNFLVKDFCNLDNPFQDLINRVDTPRMPWHDIAMMVQGKSARDVARHFIQRWNATKIEKVKDLQDYELLVPKCYDDADDFPPLFDDLQRVKCQIIRSASKWSAGIEDVDDSIQQAYVEAIEKSEHFVYIENQFFVTLTSPNNYVSNKIADAILQRILRAHREGKLFRVYVVMPLVPAFEGEVGTNTGISIHAVMHWNYASICRGPHSLYTKLTKEVGDPTKYLTFYGLRTWDRLFEIPVSELVYVHSKLLIVDDRVAIIGSANINDRSLIGSRDSEIAAYIEDSETVESKMANLPFLAGLFVGSLRKNIFSEHLGLHKKPQSSWDLKDPVCEKFFKEIWLKTAAVNTKIFENVFKCVPSDSVLTFAQMKQYIKKVPMEVDRALKELENVQGQLVLLPLHFLSEEVLLPPTGSKESFAPTSLWT